MFLLIFHNIHHQMKITIHFKNLKLLMFLLIYLIPNKILVIIEQFLQYHIIYLHLLYKLLVYLDDINSMLNIF